MKGLPEKSFKTVLQNLQQRSFVNLSTKYFHIPLQIIKLFDKFAVLSIFQLAGSRVACVPDDLKGKVRFKWSGTQARSREDPSAKKVKTFMIIKDRRTSLGLVEDNQTHIKCLYHQRNKDRNCEEFGRQSM